MRPMNKQNFFSLVNGLIGKGITPAIKHGFTRDVSLIWEEGGKTYIERLSCSKEIETAYKMEKRFEGWLKLALVDGFLPSDTKQVIAEKGTEGERAKSVEIISVAGCPKTYRIITQDGIEYLWREGEAFARRYVTAQRVFGKTSFGREVRGKEIITRLSELVNAWDVDREHSKIISIISADGLRAESQGIEVIVQVPCRDDSTGAEIFTPRAVATVSEALDLLLSLPKHKAALEFGELWK